jgi:hypothetical protein
VSGIGEFLREIMPAWLSRPARDRTDLMSGRYAHAQGTDDARELAREADEVWDRHVAAGLHCEAFPEAIAVSAQEREGREKPAGANGLH